MIKSFKQKKKIIGQKSVVLFCFFIHWYKYWHISNEVWLSKIFRKITFRSKRKDSELKIALETFLFTDSIYVSAKFFFQNLSENNNAGLGFL